MVPAQNSHEFQKESSYKKIPKKLCWFPRNSLSSAKILSQFFFSIRYLLDFLSLGWLTEWDIGGPNLLVFALPFPKCHGSVQMLQPQLEHEIIGDFETKYRICLAAISQGFGQRTGMLQWGTILPLSPIWLVILVWKWKFILKYSERLS